MEAASIPPIGNHWLVRLAGRAGLSVPEGFTVPASETPTNAWNAVAEACGVDQAALAQLVAEQFKLPVANLANADPGVIGLVPAVVARRHLIVPLRDQYRSLVVATADPVAVDVEQEIAFASGRNTSFEIAPPDELAQVVEQLYAPDRVVETLLERVDDSIETDITVVEDRDPDSIDEAELEHAPVIRLTNLMIRDAVTMGASDIHFQPGSTGGAVRVRVDGVLRPYSQIPVAALDRVVSRLKVMARMDIADRLRPQDGRARVRIGGQAYELRVSTVPTRGSEKAVVRILDPSSSHTLSELRYPKPEQEKIERIAGFRDGIVFVTGPTGSGKTTTLYAVLQAIATEGVNIITVEDPVEYELPGITQIQVEKKQNVTFASALRAILRQDPDVILVGEIRDLETAEVAIQAALTGHLVLATLHTNSAAGAIPRLVDIGLDRPAIADAMRGVLAQRLVRRKCPACEGPAVLDRAGKPTGPTCSECGGGGYKGRVPIAEVLEITPKIVSMILDGAGTAAINTAAIGEGMRSMREVALERVEMNETTLDEVERVLGEGAEDEYDGVAEAEAADSDDESPKVLVVDDDGAVRVVVRALLEREGWRVTELADGAEAAKLLEAEPDFSMVVLDLGLPGMDGREVLKRIRGSVRTAAMPVVVLTGSEDPDAETELLREGADDYVRKPLDPAKFVARAVATLRRSRG